MSSLLPSSRNWDLLDARTLLILKVFILQDGLVTLVMDAFNGIAVVCHLFLPMPVYCLLLQVTVDALLRKLDQAVLM